MTAGGRLCSIQLCFCCLFLLVLLQERNLFVKLMKSVVKVLQTELMNHLVFPRCLLKTRRDVYVTAKRVCYVYYSWYVEISHQIQVLNPAHPLLETEIY